MSQDLAIWLIAAATIAAIYRFGRRGGRRPPDLSAGATDRLPGPVAAERICRQIEEIETELKLLAAARRELPTPEKLRAKWEKACVVAELGRSPIEATKVKGAQRDSTSRPARRRSQDDRLVGHDSASLR